MKFQITGLPRSGTAWISSVLNYAPDVICVHESPDQNIPVPKDDYRSCGESGSHLLLPELRDADADLRVFIYRSTSDCYTSLQRQCGHVPEDWFNDHLIPMGREYFEMADIVLDYKEMFSFAPIRKVWNAISESKFDADKVAMMLGMNVQKNSLEYSFEEGFMGLVRKNHNIERSIS